MKVFLRYEDNNDAALHKLLKITLPKSWKNGPTSRILQQFVESYNANETLGAANPLSESELHLAIRKPVKETSEETVLVDLPSNAITIEVIPDRSDLFVMHGPSQTLEDIALEAQQETERIKALQESTVACLHFGCKNRFPKEGPYPDCVHHVAPPVFHETAKFWSCCPTKKAYDWDDFQNIPGCQTGTCTNVKDEDKYDEKQFLGGSDMREAAGRATKLKSIDDFNKSEAAGGSEAAPVLDRLRLVMKELGVENELFDQVLNGIQQQKGLSDTDSPEALEEVKAELGSKLKAAMKSIAAEQLRLK
jgi:hypothetical protein